MMAARNKPYVDKFKLPKILEYKTISLKGVGGMWDKPKELFLHSPKSLVNLCADILDQQPLPECMHWKTEEVLEWLEKTVGLPQYKSCFEVNFVHGRSLILLGPSNLVRMNIKNFDHLKKIMNAIRALYGVPKPNYAQNLTKPTLHGTEYDWNTLYYRHIARQSSNFAMLRSEYWRKAKMMNTHPETPCHWDTIITSQGIQGKVIVARVRPNKKKQRYYVPKFREGNYLPTRIRVDYLDSDPLSW